MKHILIVEDDTTFAVMLQTWLSKKKFSVASVSGIAAAKKTLIESSVDLVLCDLRLPDGDGIDLLEWVAQKKQSFLRKGIRGMKRQSPPISY